MPDLPEPVAALAAELSALPGAGAVALGGSRATGTHRPDSDWDLGLYYRGSLDPDGLRRLGHHGYVSELGEWGPIMNGGAWLTIAGTPVDVLFRDLDRVEAWLADAREGRFEVLAQNGYLVGAPTYVAVAEMAINEPLFGELPSPDFPDSLAAAAPSIWEGRARVALMFADLHEQGGDAVPRGGMLAQATLCVAHARLAERREWVVNEKRLVERAGLDEAAALLSAGARVREVSRTLGVEPLSAR